MNKSVGIRALQQHASQVITRVVAGEEIEVTDRGRPVARLVPLSNSKRDQLIAAGRLRPAVRPLEKLPPLTNVDKGQPTAGEVLAAMRAHER